jgi:hypothetical protein
MNGWSRCATEAAIWMQAENRATDLDRLVQIELVDIALSDRLATRKLAGSARGRNRGEGHR